MVVPLLSFRHSLDEATQHEDSVFNRKYWLYHHIPWEIDPHIQITQYPFHCRKTSQSMHLFPLSGAAHSILFSKYWSASLDFVKNGNNQSISWKSHGKKKKTKTSYQNRSQLANSYTHKRGTWQENHKKDKQMNQNRLFL